MGEIINITQLINKINELRNDKNLNSLYLNWIYNIDKVIEILNEINKLIGMEKVKKW